jgi:hypothetical protein
MKKVFLALLFFGFAFQLFAAKDDGTNPISVGMAFDYPTYIVGEEIPVKIMIRNNMPFEIILGRGETPVVDFDVRRHHSDSAFPLVTDCSKLGLPKPFRLLPNQTRTFTLKLSAAVDIQREGSYLITFGAIHNGIRYDTESKLIHVDPGMVVSTGLQLFKNDPNRQRQIYLVRASRDKTERLFLRVEDKPDGRFFPSVMLGAYLPLVEPRMHIANNGEIVVLHRATPEYFVRNVFWSLPNDFVHRSQVSVVDPSTADTARLHGLKDDFDEIIKKDEERRKERLRSR